MRFFDSKLWNRIRANEKLYGFIHNTIGLWIKNYGLRDRINEMKSTGLSTFFEIDHLLENEDCHFFADFGTLLGFVRNGKLLSWDYDIDFGICFNDRFTWSDLQKVLTRIGFQLAKQFTFHGEITEQTYKRNNTYIDFFLHFIEEDSSLYYIYYAKKDFQYENSNQLHARTTRTVKITGVKKYDVDGGYIHVPIEYETYLSDVYGADWRIPNPNWFAKSAPNITFLNDYGILEEFENVEK